MELTNDMDQQQGTKVYTKYDTQQEQLEGSNLIKAEMHTISSIKNPTNSTPLRKSRSIRFKKNNRIPLIKSRSICFKQTDPILPKGTNSIPSKKHHTMRSKGPNRISSEETHIISFKETSSTLSTDINPIIPSIKVPIQLSKLSPDFLANILSKTIMPDNNVLLSPLNSPTYSSKLSSPISESITLLSDSSC